MKNTNEIHVGLLGCGTVGSGVYKILTENRKILEERIGRRVVLKKILVKDAKKKRSVPSALLTDDPDVILKDPKISIVAEVMGGLQPAESYLLQALEAGKDIVTANKALLAEKGNRIFTRVRENGRSIGFEASVAGGIPIIKALREGFVGNKIQEVYGIINGTSNFILSAMTEKGEDFRKVLAEAQKLGYAEQDPTFDVKGIDAVQKLAILISLCYGTLPSWRKIFVEGIDTISALDIESAKKLGYVIKLLAIANEEAGGIQARVHPTMIPENHPLADVNGVYNAIFLKGDAVGNTMFLGRGAGMMPTASAVVSDIVMAATGVSGAYQVFPKKTLPLRPIEDLTSEYYLRFSVLDRPGVLAQIAKELGAQEISIANMYQEDRSVGARVPIVVMTHEARERNVLRAIRKIDGLKTVVEKTKLIRVQGFERV